MTIGSNSLSDNYCDTVLSGVFPLGFRGTVSVADTIHRRPKETHKKARSVCCFFVLLLCFDSFTFKYLCVCSLGYLFVSVCSVHFLFGHPFTAIMFSCCVAYNPSLSPLSCTSLLSPLKLSSRRLSLLLLLCSLSRHRQTDRRLTPLSSVHSSLFRSLPPLS